MQKDLIKVIIFDLDDTLYLERTFVESGFKAVAEYIEKKFKKLNLDLKYYSPKIHFASAVLPKYLIEELKLK